jgi:hypothetical protein
MIKEYKTCDIVLAASLIVHNFKLSRIDISGNRGTFVFEHIDDTFLTDYEIGNILVEPTLFNNQIKRLTTSVRRMIQFQ